MLNKYFFKWSLAVEVHCWFGRGVQLQCIKRRASGKSGGDVWASSCSFLCSNLEEQASRCQILRVLNQGKVALCDKWLLNWKCHLLIRCDIKIKNIQVDHCYMTIWMVHCKYCVVCTSLIKNISEMIAARRYKVCNNIMTLSNVCRGYNVTSKSTLK